MLKHKKYSIIILLVSLAVWIGIAVIWRVTSSPCRSAPSVLCSAEGFEITFHPLLLAFAALAFVSGLLIFLRRKIFIVWAKFAAIGFPLMLGGLLYTYNIEQSMGGWVSGPTESEIAAVLLPGLFLLISLGIIIYKSIKK